MEMPTTASRGDEYLSQAQFLEEFDISPTTAYRWRQDGLPFIKKGKLLFYRRQDISRFLNGGLTSSTQAVS
ncbi:MAG: helix-turn-helix domain-containing protein [Bacteroidota bacterium]